VKPCPAMCARAGAPIPLSFTPSRGDRGSLKLLLHSSGPFELIVARARGARLRPAEPVLINRSPREVLAGIVPRHARLQTVSLIALPRLHAGIRAATVALVPTGKPLPRGVYILRVAAVTRAGRVREAGGAIAVRIERGNRFASLLEAQDLPPPSAQTETVSAVEAGLTANTATVGGLVNPGGLETTYEFQYGTSPSYGAHTPGESAGGGTAAIAVSSSLSGLSGETTYDYRLVATQCQGCAWGTVYGPEQSFTTPATVQQLSATRAIATYDALQQSFYAASVTPGEASSLYTNSYPSAAGAYAGLWPFSRVLTGTITLAGIAPELLAGANYQSAVSDRLIGLSRYWDTNSSPPGYNGIALAPYGSGGSLYYDDQAWVGMAAVQDYRLTGDQAALTDAENAWAFVYPGGWASSWSFEPGGVWWVQQGVGPGVTNHYRTTTSTAPNAELGLLLADANHAGASTYEAAASQMYGWANEYLYNVSDDPLAPGPNPNYVPSKPALMFDKVKSDNTIDETPWTYDQGAMIAASVREYQLTGKAAYLQEAQDIATTALGTFTESDYVNQPAAFDAVFFRDLLVLCSVTPDPTMRARIMQAIETYANDAWTNYRSASGLFRFPSSSGSGYQLLDQGAMLQLFAALAWNPSQYAELP
jgi:hypothetical protein